MLGAPGVAVALTWSVTDPVPSPAPNDLAPIAQDWLVGDLTSGRWSAATVGPIDARALTESGPGGTIYAASAFETEHVGAVAIRVRTDAIFRVWLDGRLIGGLAQAQSWKTTPVAFPAALDSGAHRLLVELRPAYGRSAHLAAAVTAPDGKSIAVKPLVKASVRATTAVRAPMAIKAVNLPPRTRPAQIWTRPSITGVAPIAAPEMPDLDALQTMPRWPDAEWSLLSDTRHWVLDTRQRARRVVGRVNAQTGLMAARTFLRGFDTIAIVGPDGPAQATSAAVEVGSLFIATRVDALPPDPLMLGAARLQSAAVPTWRMAITVEAPRGWTVARRARGIGGARVVDEIAGRRQWQYRADALAPGAAHLRVSRADGEAGFTRLVNAALRDHLRPYPGQPKCGDAQDADALTRAIVCARDGAEVLFVRAPGRPTLEGPVDVRDFDAITQTVPDWAEGGLRIDGTRIRGPGVGKVSVELTPSHPEPPAVALGGPCGARSVADVGTMQTETTVRLAGIAADPPRARRTTAGPLTHVRHVERTATGWRTLDRLSWAGLNAVSPARLAAACRRLVLP